MSFRVPALFALPAIALAVIFIVLGFLWWPFYLLVLPAAAAVVTLLWWRADDAAIASLNARGAGEIEGQRFRNALEALCLRVGLEQPALMVVDSDATNLAAISIRRNTLVATSTLLAKLDAMQTEGVVAHAIMKLMPPKPRYQALVASAPWAMVGLQKRLARRWDEVEDGVVQYDLAGVELTRYPPGLRSALELLDDSTTEVMGGEHLGTTWLVPPHAERTPISHRVEVLGEL